MVVGFDPRSQPDTLDPDPCPRPQARRCGIRVILSLVDNWKYPGGVDEVVDWSPTAPRRTQDRPPDKEGDSEFVVRSAASFVAHFSTCASQS